MYVPRKQKQQGTYEGIWSGPYSITVSRIRRSHKTRPEQTIAKGHEDDPIRIQRIESDNYDYQIVDGNKRLIRAKRLGELTIIAYVWEDKDERANTV